MKRWRGDKGRKIMRELFQFFLLKVHVRKMWKWKKRDEFYKTTYSIGIPKCNLK